MLENTSTFRVDSYKIEHTYDVEYFMSAIHTMTDDTEWIKVCIEFTNNTLSGVTWDNDLLNLEGEWFLVPLIAKTIIDIKQQLRGGDNK